LKRTWFVLPTNVKYVNKQKTEFFILIKKLKINSQMDRPFVSQQTVLKHRRLKFVAVIDNYLFANYLF